jgi:hypothetical protein
MRALLASALVVGVAALLVACPASLDERCAGGACDPRPDDGGAPDVVDAPEGCDPNADPRNAPKCVVDSFGVFVAPGGSGDGSMKAPLGSIEQAINVAYGRGIPRVYICDGDYDEHVALEKKTISLYGGLNCGDWSASSGRAKIHPTSTGFALLVKSLRAEDKTLVVQHLDLESAPATGPGESSVGVFVLTSADVSLRDVRIAAGAGKSASDAASFASNYDPVDLTGGSIGAAPNNLTGGAKKSNACKVFGSSTGGAGGNSGTAGDPKGKPGDPGEATPVAAPQGIYDGHGGAGDVSGSGCTEGGLGANGVAGKGGKRAAAIATISDAGWTPGAGTDGEPGNPAQGGGGGGGHVPPENAGGGGGAGGCGGAKGHGAGGGGGSIALLVASSKVAIEGSEIYSADGGKGGDGTPGQQGQTGGTGGTGGCEGRAGGQGAGGSGGAGGAGGASIGIAYAGSAPTVDGAPAPKTAPTLGVVRKVGTAGARGSKGAAGPAAAGGVAPGAPGNDGEDGLDGIAVAVWSP